MHGRVIAVTEEVDGDYLETAVTAGTTSLQLEDVSPFDEGGGKALIVDEAGREERVVYTDVDFDTDIMTITSGVLVDYEAGTKVLVRPEHKERYAAIQPDDEEVTPFRARVPFVMKSQLPIGQRSIYVGDNDVEARPPEEVVVRMVRGEWVVRDILGQFPISDEKFMAMPRTFTVPGDIEVGRYPQPWTADKRYRIVGLRARAGSHEEADHPDDGVPQGADILLNVLIEDAASSTYRAVLSGEDKLRINSGTHKDSQWIREEDVDWKVKFIDEDESVTIKCTQVGSTTAGGPVEVTLMLVPEEVQGELILERAAEFSAVADLQSSGEGGLPIFRSAGAGTASTIAITPAMAADVKAGDILLLFLETADQAITVSGGTETWTEVADSPVSVAGVTRLTCFWARASQDAPTSPTTSDSGDHQLGVIIAIRRGLESGTPVDVTAASTEATVDTSASATGDTTTVDRTLVVVAITSSVAGTFTNWVNADLLSITEVADVSTTQGNDGSIGVAVGGKADAGAFGATTADLSVSGAKAMLVIAVPGEVI